MVSSCNDLKRSGYHLHADVDADRELDIDGGPGGPRGCCTRSIVVAVAKIVRPSDLALGER